MLNVEFRAIPLQLFLLYGFLEVIWFPRGSIPFFAPREKIVGQTVSFSLQDFSYARIVDVFARRLQVQERMTDQIVKSLDSTLNPLGVAVVIEARHMCMMMRGVQKQNSLTTTSAFTGEFQRVETRSEFLNLIGSKLH